MSVRIPQGYIVTSIEAIDNRLVLTKPQMKNMKDEWMPESYLAVCAEPDYDDQGKKLYKIYLYNKHNSRFNEDGTECETGKFKPFAGDYRDLVNKPSINGVPVDGSEGADHYSLQNKLYAMNFAGDDIDRGEDHPGFSFGPGIEIDNYTWDPEHISGIKVLFDGETIKADSETNLLYIDLTALFHNGDAIDISIDENNPRKASINVLFDSETIWLENSELTIPYDSERAIDVDKKGFYVKVDDKTIKYDTHGQLYALPEPFNDGVATHVVHKTELWDSESINLVYDSEKGLEVDPDNQLFIKVNEGQALEFDGVGRMQVKLNDSEGIDFNNDGELFIKINGDKALEFNPNSGDIQVKLVDSEGIDFDPRGRLHIKKDDTKGLAFDSEGNLYIKLEYPLIFEDGAIKIKSRPIYTSLDFGSEGGNGLYVLIDDDTIHRDDNGNLELHLDSEQGIDTNAAGDIFIKIDKNTIHFDPNGRLILKLNNRKGIDVDNTGRLYVRVDSETVFFDNYGRINVHYDSERSLHLDHSNGKFFVEVDRDTVRHVNNELQAKKVVAGDAIKLNDIYGGDTTVHVVADSETGIYVKRGGTQSKLAIKLSNSEGMAVHGGKIYTKLDYSTLVFDNTGKIKVPLDNTTIIVNSEGKVHVDIDNDTIIYSTSEREVRVEVPNLHLRGHNADFDSERADRIRDDSELRARADNIEAHLFFVDSQGNILTPTSSELSRPDTIIYTTYQDKIDRLEQLDESHYTYIDATTGKKIIIPANWSSYDQVYGVYGNAGDMSPDRKPKMAHVSPTDRDKWNRVVGKQNKLILEDTTNNTHYKNALLLYANGSQDTRNTCATSEITLRIDNSSIVMRSISEGGYLELYADGYIHRPPHTEGLIVITDSQGQPYWTPATMFGAVDGLAVHDDGSTYRLKLNNKILQLYLGNGLDYSTSEGSEGKLFVNLEEIKPFRPQDRVGKNGKALILDSEGDLSWGEAGKVDALKVRDDLGHEKILKPENKIVTLPVEKGLQITSEGKIIHVNEVSPQTITTDATDLSNNGPLFIPNGVDTQGHLTDATANVVGNSLRRVTMNGKAYSGTTTGKWAVVDSVQRAGNNVPIRQNLVLNIAGYDNTNKYANATLKIEADGISANYKAKKQKVVVSDTSEELIIINGNELSLRPQFLSRLQLLENAKNVIDSEGYNNTKYYPTIRLLKTELDAKQDLLTAYWPAVITSEGASEGPNKLFVLYDNDSIKLNNKGELVTKDVYLATLPGIPLSDIVPTDANSENPMTSQDFVQDAISSNLGRFQGNFTSEGDLPTKATVPALARNDYAFVTIPVYDSQGNVEYFYYRYKYVDDTSETGHWQFEYQVSGSTFTYNQLLALNSNWNAQLTTTAKNHFNNADIHITAAERTTWNNKQDKLTAGDHINATSLAAKVIKVDTSGTTISDSTNSTHPIETNAAKAYFKKQQTAVDSNNVSASSEGVYFISRIQQDAQGVVTPTKVAYTYNNIPNKPQINGVTLVGNKVTEDLIQAKNGIKIDTDHKISHTNSVTAQTTAALRAFTFDAQGHITGTPTTKTFGRGIDDQSNVIGHSNTAITAETTGIGSIASNALKVPTGIKYDTYGHITAAMTEKTLNARNGVKITGSGNTWYIEHTNSVTAATNVGKTGYKIPYFSYDAQGHFTSSGTRDLFPIFGGAGKVLGIKSGNSELEWVTLPEGTAYTAGTGLSLSGTVFNHSNSVSANTTSGLKYFTYDAQGHVTAATNKTLGRGISDSSNVIGHSNTAITAGTIGSATQIPKLTYDAYGHITAVDTTVTVYPPTAAGTSGQVWVSNGSGAGSWRSVGRGLNYSSSVIGHSNTAITADTTSSLRAFAVDAYGHTTAYTAKSLGRGIDDQSNVIGHSNSITANTTSGLKYFTYDAYGHVASAVNKTLGRGLSDSSNVIGHSNSVTAASNVGQADFKIPYFSYDAYGHITGSGTKDIFPTLTGNAGKVLKVNSSANGVEWGSGGGGGGGGNYNFTGTNGITIHGDSENVEIRGYTAGTGINISGSTISAVASAPTFAEITGDAKSNSNLNAYLTALEAKDTELDNKKQNKLLAGAGITLTNSGDTTTISSSYEASDSIGIVNNKFEVTSPINGGNLITVEGDWDSTGHTINAVTGAITSSSLVTGTTVKNYTDSTFKKIQTASDSGSKVGYYISRVTQNAQGVITPTWTALPTIPTVGNGAITLQVNGTTKGSFTVNQSSASTINMALSYNELTDRPPAGQTPNDGVLTLTDVVVSSRSKTFSANTANNVTLELHGTDVYLERW